MNLFQSTGERLQLAGNTAFVAINLSSPSFNSKVVFEQLRKDIENFKKNLQTYSGGRYLSEERVLMNYEQYRNIGYEKKVLDLYQTVMAMRNKKKDKIEAKIEVQKSNVTFEAIFNAISKLEIDMFERDLFILYCKKKDLKKYWTFKEFCIDGNFERGLPKYKIGKDEPEETAKDKYIEKILSPKVRDIYFFVDQLAAGKEFIIKRTQN